ncbi:MAG: NADPH-dependent glutamate synthase [Bacteroidales bacterium]|nr:NADPH-dependent glutamate synthase [Bacteroidales bacterium]
MFEIIRKEMLAGDTVLMEVMAPRIAKSALPGQFLIVRIDEKGERIPLTISDFDEGKGTVVIVFKVIGKTTTDMSRLEVGECLADVVGPLGKPSEFVHYKDDYLRQRKYVFIGGGVGIAPIYPQVKYLYEHGAKADVIIGAKTHSMLIYEKELASMSNLFVTTDDGTSEYKGLVTDMLQRLVKDGNHYDEIVAIGPMIMMKFVTLLAQKLGIHCTISLNSLMVDGTGMCGACRVSVAGHTRFVCVDGPEFDGALVDFDIAMKRQAMYNNIKGFKELEREEKAEGHKCHIGGIAEERRDNKKRVPIREQAPAERAKNFDEVCYGYNAEEVVVEAQRCLNCKNPQCVQGCPVNIRIPDFIHHVAEGDFKGAAEILGQDTALPSVCGRVCPQETQCEGSCVMGRKFEPIAIGKIERFVGDYMRENNIRTAAVSEPNGHKVAVIGSGPSGLTCAKELAANGCEVTVFEALHRLGGVLTYGIPAFRLPKETVVDEEIRNVERLGVKFEKDVIIGRTVSIDELFEEGFEAVFVGSGAGLPKFMGIPGENFCGVVSANEFLTRNNLLKSYKEGYETPNFVGKRVAVVGGGNVAMDAARTALRLGAKVNIVYRRSMNELPARAEEVHHAEEEGIVFNMLTNPVEILGDDNGWVNGMKCVKMVLGEPDASGRRSPVEEKGSDFVLDVDMVIMALGTSSNPLVFRTTPGLEADRRECIIADEATGATTRENVYAGGDAVSGASTVILAMGAGKRAAKAILEKFKAKK